ncbi:radical SAM family heme chaperone HemW [Alkaliphilus hydrothermalis]|uniref:Heme chaperone HemW n=1 Tax=Alkaliphilus hydrothermalis TaxID=1482730 RepID=A0ABS2NP03_9FIRM|nr:radical SAM family heme chaperone HemW [Alkaliphilus hydrothermalis]MBM7614666.1 oxygen-independent coproporphyrinogen-3 oxidase [Alkaliphilus hydrothermalis]
MKPISIYIHIPFCERKCFYCDFNSYGGKKELIQPYLEALLREIDLYEEELRNYEVKTIFFGGGTPSLLTGEQMTSLMNRLIKRFHIGKNPEITMEMNPGTVTYDQLKKYYNAGVNRLSIGLQACQDHLLEKLGRIHNYQQFLQNLKAAQEVGFDNINVDLMFALPGQKIEDWKVSLREITNLGIQHISAYSLIWEEDTPFYDWNVEGKLKELDEELELNMYHEAINFLQQEGYQHYEISNFSKPGYQCQHNLTYWHNQSYLGLGAGAHSYRLSKRYNNEGDVSTYIKILSEGKLPIVDIINNSREDEISETMFLGLRLMEGILIKDFQERFGVSPLEIYGGVFEKLIKEGLITIDDKRIQLTATGIDLSNLVFQEMLL